MILTFAAGGKGETMRLIDADELGIGMCNPDVFSRESKLYAEGWNQAIKILQEAPMIDAVEVIRCKDCRHMVLYNNMRWCSIWRMPNGSGDDGFCNYGERKEEK